MERIAPSGDIYQAGTLSGKPLAMAAGFETLNAMTPKKYEALNQKTDRLMAGDKQAAKDNNLPRQVNRAGSMVGFFFTDEPVTNVETAQTANTERFGQYYRGMIEGRVFRRPSQFEGLFFST